MNVVTPAATAGSEGRSQSAQQTAGPLENMLPAWTDGIVVTDATQDIVLVNDAFCAFFNCTGQDMDRTGLLGWLERLDGDAPKRWAELEAEIRRTGAGRDVQFRMVTADGVRYFDVNLALLEPKACRESGSLISVWREAAGRRRTEQDRALRQRRLEGLRGLQEELLSPGPVDEKLDRIAAAAVELLDLDFCRIWVVRPADLCDAGCIHAEATDAAEACCRRRCLHLTASAGRYTHLDGDHRRVPLGRGKIGRIATAEDKSLRLSDVANDPQVQDHRWARELGLVSFGDVSFDDVSFDDVSFGDVSFGDVCFAGYPLRDASGGPIGVLAAFAGHPITEEEDALLANIGHMTSQFIVNSQAQERLSRLSAIVESSDDAIVAESPDGAITFWNEGARLLFGYTREEALGRPASIIVPSDLVFQERVLLEKARRGQRTDHLDTVRRHKDGARIDVSVNVSPIKDAAGKVIGVSTISRDIADRKQSEQHVKDYALALESSNRALEGFSQAAEAANRAKSEFLANMSHEIRTPMTAILGFAEVLLGNLEKQQDLSAADTIMQNGRYLLELINDILDLSKIEAGKLEVEQITCSPAAVVGDVASLMRVRADAKNLPLQVEYAGAVPETVRSDPTRLRQILINLLGNAIKFTETGSVRLVTRLFPGGDGRPRLQFDVVDTGIGMTEAQAARLFRPFTQADSSTSRKFGGTGLGLTISKRLAEMLGGDISVRSSPGKGSTFTLTIEPGPLGQVGMLENPAEAIAESRQKAKAAAAVKVELNGRILLAEDGPDNQRLISFLLEKAGADVTLAENGQIAHQKALAARSAAEPFDVVLMDMQMPVMDGYQATRRLRRDGYDYPIVALTANAMAGDRQKCLQAGCDDFATKPIDRAKFFAIIAGHLKAHSGV